MVPSPSGLRGDTSDAGVKQPVSILVVEDDPLVASYIQEVLEESGFAIAGIASSGPEAMSLAGDGRPALALVDIKLAGPMDGIEVARLMRSRFNVQSIFLSGTCDPETMERAKDASPLGFLEKPFRPSQVFNALQRALTDLHHS
jgi:two-component system, response regulator PdtaR